MAEVKRAREWTLVALQEADVRQYCDGGNYLLIWPQRPVDAVDAALREVGILVRSMAGKPPGSMVAIG